MPKKSYSPTDVTAQLKKVDNEIRRGASVAKACKKIGVSRQAYQKMKKETGAAPADPAKRLKELERENTRLKNVVNEIWMWKEFQ